MCRRCLPLFLLLIGPAFASWSAAAPPRSPACDAALRSLQHEEDRVAAAQQAASAAPAPATAAHLKALQQHAAKACLGPAAAHAADVPPRSPHVAAPPVTVLRPAAPLSASPALPRVVAPPPALPAARLPLSATACDAAGCWASDGTRLQRVGPNLVGPRGICTQQGALLSCP